MPRPLSEAELAELYALQVRNNAFEDLIAGIAQAVLLPGDGAVDGGAFLGLHTVRLGKLVGPAGWVLAFEPQPNLAKRLAYLLGASAPHASCRVVAAALGDVAGKAGFQRVVNKPAYSGLRLRQLDFVPEVETLEVECTTLDAATAGRRGLAFIKLDLEGGEFRALQGGEETLRRDRPVLVLEDGGRPSARLYGYSGDDYFAFFARHGYRLLDLYGRPHGPEEQDLPHRPFYSVALPRGSGAEAKLLQCLPAMVRALLAGRNPRTAC